MGSDGVGRSLSELPFHPCLPARLGAGPGIPQFKTQLCLSLFVRLWASPRSLWNLCFFIGAVGTGRQAGIT